MDSIGDFCQTFIQKVSSKIFRVFLMFILTITTATVEIIFGIRSHSNSLIADGLYSFAEGICLIGVMLVLRWSQHAQNYDQKNTFGHERLELLFGLIQEVFLLSISLGIIVDAINHLANPAHVHDPELMIFLGVLGIFVGILGMIMFWGYHHDHDIEEEINEKRRTDFLSTFKKHTKSKHKSPTFSRQTTVVSSPLLTEPEANETMNLSEKKISDELKPSNIQPRRLSNLDAFTYENVQIGESRIYATLHALCLHSFVVLLESVIVVLSGSLIQLIPHKDPVTGKEINVWLKYIDPSLTLIMVVIIAIRAVPVIFSISRILIENVPDGIDTRILMKEIILAVPAIKSIHSLHIWRATAKEIYATLHVVCEDDIPLSVCTNNYGEEIQKILRSYCIRYFTLQFEYLPSDLLEQAPAYRCAHGLHRRRRGHSFDESNRMMTQETKLDIQ